MVASPGNDNKDNSDLLKVYDQLCISYRAIDDFRTNWTWVSGSDTANQYGVYGTEGIASSSNVPGARDGAVSWIDGSGNFWLFGGQGYDSTGNWDVLNDLWRYKLQ